MEQIHKSLRDCFDTVFGLFFIHKILFHSVDEWYLQQFETIALLALEG